MEDQANREDLSRDIEVETRIGNITEQLNTMYSLLSKQMMLRYDLMIYRLVRRGHVGTTALAECANISRIGIYKKLEEVEKMLRKEKSIYDP